MCWTESSPARCPAPTATNTVPGVSIRSAIQSAQRALRLVRSTLRTLGFAFNSSSASSSSAVTSPRAQARSEEHTSELQSLMRISYAVFCLKKKTNRNQIQYYTIQTTFKNHTQIDIINHHYANNITNH